MAVTLCFTLYPLRSLLANQRAAKKTEASSVDGDDLPVPKTVGGALRGRFDPAETPALERINVKSTSPAAPRSAATYVSEQALLAARSRLDV